MMINVNAAFWRNSKHYLWLLAFGFMMVAVEAIYMGTNTMHAMMVFSVFWFTMLALVLFFDERPNNRDWCRITSRRYETTKGIIADILDSCDYHAEEAWKRYV